LQLVPAVDPIPVGPGGRDDDPPVAVEPPVWLLAAAVDASALEYVGDTAVGSVPAAGVAVVTGTAAGVAAALGRCCRVRLSAIRALANFLVLAFALALALLAAFSVALSAAAARAAMATCPSADGFAAPTAASCWCCESEGRGARRCPPSVATPASTTQPAATKTITRSRFVGARSHR
jgi:hypothetical protein